MDLIAARDDPEHYQPFDRKKFRGVCGLFVTGVAVITTHAGDHPVGVTVNSFASVSLDPPLVLFCIHQDSKLWPAVKSTASFVVNILAEDQADVCRLFASNRSTLFSIVDSHYGQTGGPIIDDSLGYLECALDRVMEGGDHLIVVGKVISLGAQRDHSPLTFFRSAHPRLESEQGEP